MDAASAVTIHRPCQEHVEFNSIDNILSVLTVSATDRVTPVVVEDEAHGLAV